METIEWKTTPPATASGKEKKVKRGPPVRGIDCGQRMTFAVDLDALRKQVGRCFV
jgi:hypothetical protein